MATMTISSALAALAVENLPLSIPLKTYAVNHDSAERADPSPPMQPPSQIRNRGQEGRPSKLVTANTSDSSPSTTQTPTPDSDNHTEQVEGNGIEELLLLA
jgi:hypothetical protein